MNGLQTDSESIIKFLSVMFDSNDVFEIRLLKAKVFGKERTVTGSGYFRVNEAEKVINGLGQFQCAQGVYVMMNPVDPALYAKAPGMIRTYVLRGEATGDADIPRRRLILVDDDPKREAGTSATVEEKQAAQEVDAAVNDFLDAEGFPDRVRVDSGNGFHTYIHVDLPAEDDGLVKRFLKVLGAKFDTEMAKVDCSVHNASRIAKLPGTLAAKGENTVERPHRMSKILHIPPEIKIASAELIEKIAAMTVPPKNFGKQGDEESEEVPLGESKNKQEQKRDRKEKRPRVFLPSQFNLVAFLQEQGIGLKPAKSLKDGALLYELDFCLWNPGHSSSPFIIVFLDGGVDAGCHHDSCQSFRAWNFFISLKKRFETEGRDDAVKIVQGILDLAQAGNPKAKESSSDNPVMDQLKEEWLVGTDKNGELFVMKRPMAYRRIFELDDRYRGNLRRNEMGQRDFFNGHEIRDETITEIENDLDSRYRLSGGVDLLNRQVNAVCAENAFHPVCDNLESCPAWDGVNRIDRVLVGVLGAAPTDLNRQMLRCFYVGSVARVMERGCKMDTALVLKSTFQGNRKTTFFDVHCEGIPGAFLEGHEDFISKDGLLAMHGAWIIELGEIDRITRKKDAELVKNFLSRRADVIRLPYGRRNVEMQRSFVVVGTTNNSAFLSDTTGHRRFHVIETGDAPFDLGLLRELVPQLWAQALHEYRAGNQWWLSAEMETVHELGMVDFEIDEPWNDLVTKALEAIISPHNIERPIRHLKDGVAIAEILERMGVSADRQTHSSAMRVAEILRNRNWTRPKNQVRVDGAKVRLWIPP